ncbi:hypothetical protein FHS19_002559 [Paenibacillus rhizosphaerae]|uniref:Uncharacterized protein n=1 Tax=Paenibacillus rhizosphaerae TaxID=297318 RepID=A0A839TM97_9BACL|nr:hypothetical protein [Paenibacillus rhizosphaerae]MBB3127905.1 hypothetical protein [Paenibacillus rhizosphaerae]
MSNAISKFAAVLLTVVVMYIYPAAEASQRQDDLSRIVVYNAVTQFVDAVRNKGYISPVMYRQFLKEMQATGNEFDVQMEHLHKKYHPEYTDAANPGTFQNTFSTVYEGSYTSDIMDRIFPENALPNDDVSRIYKLTAGDFFKVTVKNVNRTPGTVMLDFITGALTGETAVIAFLYGGMVINEDY